MISNNHLDFNQYIATLFSSAKEEVFQDGMESDFSRNLVEFIICFDSAAVAALADYMMDKEVNLEVVSEALRWLGQIKDFKTQHDRLWLLEHSLDSESAVVRDGAIVGLSAMDDPEAIPYLKKRLDQETNRLLRKDIQQLLEQLNDTQREQAQV